MNLMWTFIDGGERRKKNAENQSKAAKVAKLIVARHIDESTRCAGCCHSNFCHQCMVPDIYLVFCS